MTTQTPTSEHGETDAQEKKESNLKDRLLLPVFIPVIASIAVALMGISFSRIFLAGANPGSHGEEAAEVVEHATKSSAPVMWATIITLLVLFGAAGISLMKSMRATSFTLLISGVIVAVILSGSVLAGAGDVQVAEGNFGEPTPAEIETADPANVVEIDALSTNLFQANEFSAKPGVVTIKYIGVGGSHRLKFDGDVRFNWFDLPASPGSLEEQPVVLEAGKYVVFCPIPGHENMRADLVVQ